MNYSIEESLDGTLKIVFEKGHHCVIIPKKKGFTLCVSSQVGCAVGCKFCYTAKMGFLSHLSSDEIIEQYVVSLNLLKEKYGGELEYYITSFVFMGMGEPLLNTKNVYEACDRLNSEFRFSHKKITISTSGILPQMRKFIELNRKEKLALSLHSPHSDVREYIMPIAKRYSFGELIEFCNQYSNYYKDPIMIEYLMINGLTDRDKDLDTLLNCGLIKGTYINLIPLNGEMLIEGDVPNEVRYKNESETEVSRIYLGSSEETILKWKENIVSFGYKCFIRITMGEDIEAACGMLKS